MSCKHDDARRKYCADAGSDKNPRAARERRCVCGRGFFDGSWSTTIATRMSDQHPAHAFPGSPEAGDHGVLINNEQLRDKVMRRQISEAIVLRRKHLRAKWQRQRMRELRQVARVPNIEPVIWYHGYLTQLAKTSGAVVHRRK